MQIEMYPYAFIAVTTAIYGVLVNDKKFAKDHPRIMESWSGLVLVASMHLVLYPLLIVLDSGVFDVWTIAYMLHWIMLVFFCGFLAHTLTERMLDNVLDSVSVEPWASAARQKQPESAGRPLNRGSGSHRTEQ